MEYIWGSGAPECIFHNQHKTLYNLFSPDPAVSYVRDKLVTHREIFTLCSILLHFFQESLIYFLDLDAFTWILLAVFFLFQNYLGITDHTLQMYMLISPHCLCILPDSQTVETLRSACTFMCQLIVCLYQIAFWDKQRNFWPGFNVHVQPGQCFLQSPIYCETAEIWNLHHFVSCSYRVLKIKLKLAKLTFRTAISSHQFMGMLSKKCEVWKIYHTEYGPFLATDWTKPKGSGRVMG